MTSNYPESIDDFSDPSTNAPMSLPPKHSQRHKDLNDAAEALEAKVGVGASEAAAAPVGSVLTRREGGRTEWIPSPAGGGGGADSPQRFSKAQLELVPIWTPDSVINPGHFDRLFAPNAKDEPTVLADGGMTHGNHANQFKDSVARPLFSTGNGGRGLVRSVASGGIVAYPSIGVIPTDEWTLEVPVVPIGADLTALAGTIYILRAIGHKQSWTLQCVGTALSFTWEIDERDTDVSGALFQNTVTATLAAGDFPADTEKKISVVFDGASLTMVREATVIGTTLVNGRARPWGGDVTQGAGIALGADRITATSPVKAISVGAPAIYRYARTLSAASGTWKRRPHLTIGAATTAGDFPREAAGIVGHYTGWSRSRAADTQPAVRDFQVGLAVDSGCSLVRLAEFHELAVPTVVAGVLTGIDYTLLNARYGPWFAGGAKAEIHIGYTPAAMGGGSNGATPPTDFALFADYASQVIGYIEAHYPGFIFNDVVSFWNEPNMGFWSGTGTQLADLWEACQRRLIADGRSTRVGGVNGLWTETFDQAVVDRAASTDLPLPALYFHHYTGDLEQLCFQIEDMRAYAIAAGFAADIPVQVSEYNWTIASWDATPYALITSRPKLHKAWNAAYCYALVKELIGRGGQVGAFFRLGQIDTLPGNEQNMGMLSPDNPSQPWPVFSAFQLLWKHVGMRAKAETNWPNLRTLASVDTATGRVMVTYGSFRGYREAEPVSFSIEWAAASLPSAFTWKQWRVDATTADDPRLQLVAAGDETNLPAGAALCGVGVGGIEITPTVGAVLPAYAAGTADSSEVGVGFYRPRNLLTANQSSVETNLVGLQVIANATIARQVVGDAPHGGAVLRVTSAGAGQARAGSSLTSKINGIVPGVVYSVMATGILRSATPRSLKVTMNFFDASDYVGGNDWSETGVLGTPVEIRRTQIAPAGALYATVEVAIVGAGGAGEIADFDKLGFFAGDIPSNLWAAGS